MLLFCWKRPVNNLLLMCFICFTYRLFCVLGRFFKKGGLRFVTGTRGPTRGRKTNASPCIYSGVLDVASCCNNTLAGTIGCGASWTIICRGLGRFLFATRRARNTINMFWGVGVLVEKVEPVQGRES